MELIINIVKAALIGICVSIPFGPIAIMVIRNSFSKGRKSGFVTGLGATTVDSTWATVSVFFLGFAEELIDRYNTYILLAGGLVIMIVGLSMVKSNPFRQLDKQSQRIDSVSPKDYLKSVALGFSNPAAIFIMFALFAGFGVNVSPGDGFVRIFTVLAALAGGSVFYWFTFSGVFARFRRSINLKAILWINRIAGSAVACFGVYFLVRGVLAVIK